MKRIGFLTVVAITLNFLLVVTAEAAVADLTGNRLGDGVLSTIVYGFIGIFMALISMKLVDMATPGDLAKQIIEEKNIAASIVVGLLMLGICIIIAAAVAG